MVHWVIAGSVKGEQESLQGNKCYNKHVGLIPLGPLMGYLEGRNIRAFEAIKFSFNRFKDIWLQIFGFLIKGHPLLFLLMGILEI